MELERRGALLVQSLADAESLAAETKPASDTALEERCYLLEALFCDWSLKLGVSC
jgi:hypothetical protein